MMLTQLVILRANKKLIASASVSHFSWLSILSTRYAGQYKGESEIER